MKFNSKILRGFLDAAAKGGLRYYLCGVHVIGDRIESTNGNYCFVGKLDEEAVEEKTFTLIGVKIPKAAVETEIIKGDIDIAIHRDSRLNIVGSNVVEYIDGKFPNIKEKIEDTFVLTSHGAVGFNSKYLGLPAKLFGTKRFDWNVVRLEFGENKMGRITFSDPSLENIKMYVMPCRLPEDK